MKQDDVKDASAHLPLRKMRCTRYFRKTDEKDESGSPIYKGYYAISLKICNGGPAPEDFDNFTEAGAVCFNSHEQAIAFCIGRFVGKFDREVPQGVGPAFAPNDDDMMWMFDLEEYIYGSHIGEEWCGDPEWSLTKGCHSEIKARRFPGEGMATYTGIGHMGVLGMAHIVETISKDDHFGEDRRSSTAMFQYNNRMYRAARFDGSKPWVSGQSIMNSKRPHPFEPHIDDDGFVSNLNYHHDFVSFYSFDTVVRLRGKYYLDGTIIHGGRKEGDNDPMWGDKDGILHWIVDNYPQAKRYSFGMENGSLNWIREKNRSTL